MLRADPLFGALCWSSLSLLGAIWCPRLRGDWGLAVEGWKQIGSRCGGRLVGGYSRRQECWTQLCKGKKMPVMRVVDWEPEGLKKRSWCQEPWGTDWSWNHSLRSFRLYLEQPGEAKTGAVEGFAVARLCLF